METENGFPRQNLTSLNSKPHWNPGPFSALDRILSDDLTYTHSSARVDTKAQFISSIRSGELKYFSIVPDDLKVRTFGNTAVVTGRASIKAETRGQPMTMELRFTDTYVLQGGALAGGGVGIDTNS